MTHDCSTPPEFRLGDYGTELVLEFTYLDADGLVQVKSIANATRLEITFSRVLGPKDATSLANAFTRTAAFLTDGSDGLAVYRIQAGDPVDAAEWDVEGFAYIPGPPEENLRSSLARVKFVGALSTFQAPTTVPKITLTVPAVTVS